MAVDEIQLKSELDRAAARDARKADFDKTYSQALIDVAKGSLDRSRAAAERVERAAAAIGTLYAALLGVSFSVTDRPLPPRGVIPAAFLGMAIIGSLVYSAYISDTGYGSYPEPHSSPPVRMQNQVNDFTEVTSEIVVRRSYWLRLSVVALGLGVVFLPVVFIRLPGVSKADVERLVPWPSIPATSSASEASLQALVLKAQVDEAVVRRQSAARDKEDETIVWILAGVGLLLALRIPFSVRSGDAAEEEDDEP